MATKFGAGGKACKIALVLFISAGYISGAALKSLTQLHIPFYQSAFSTTSAGEN
jgi:hypothetical protein